MTLIGQNVTNLNLTKEGHCMNRKHIATVLFVMGFVLLCLSIVLAVIATGNKNIIGGADLPTFVFVFFRENNGLYSTLAFCGIVSLVASAIVRLQKRKQ